MSADPLFCGHEGPLRIRGWPLSCLGVTPAAAASWLVRNPVNARASPVAASTRTVSASRTTPWGPATAYFWATA